MKKRKPPIVLGTVLLILMGSIVVWNMPKPDPSQAPVPNGGENSPRSDVSTNQVVANANDGMKSKENTAKPTHGPGPVQASIAIVQPGKYKPKPNDSAAGTQWWGSKQ